MSNPFNTSNDSTCGESTTDSSTAGTPGDDSATSASREPVRLIPRRERDRHPFEGLWVALATPFDADGGLDLEAYRRLVEHCLRGGVQGLLALGSTGEAATLEAAERDLVIETCLEAAADFDDSVPVIVGTGSNSTAQAVAMTRRAAELGARGALVVTPYYNKPNADGMAAHFEAVAEAAPELPLVIYNVPGRTGTNLGPELLARLWQLPTAVAVKESSGDLAQIDEIVRHLPAGRIVLAGDDAHALASIALGARGLVSVMANAVPAGARALVDAALEDRFVRARSLHAQLSPLMASLFAESNPVPLKAALAHLGLATDRVRAPLAPAGEATRRRLVSDLAVLQGVAA